MSHTPEGTGPERRAKARKLRARVRMKMDMTEACARHEVSRATAYRLIRQLEAWELTATHAEQIAELDVHANQIDPGHTFRTLTDGLKWTLPSGQMIMDNAQGNDSYLGAATPAESDDPLMG